MLKDFFSTTDRITLEIYFNPYAFHETITRYQVESEGDWTKTKNGYMMKEFGNYAIILYPILPEDSDLIISLSQKIENLDRFRETLMKPGSFKDSITIHIQSDELTTSPELDLEELVGLSLVNDVLSQKGIVFKEKDDLILVSIKIERPLTSSKLSEYLSKLAIALKLYYKIKEEQEDVALKTSLSFLQLL